MTISSEQTPIGYQSVQIANGDDVMPTINLNESIMNVIPAFIREIRNTGQLVYHQIDGEKEVVANLCQSPLIGDVSVEEWAIPVRLIYGEEEFYVLLQRFKLSFVGFRVSNGAWILPKGDYQDRVAAYVDAKFPASDTVEPKLVDLGMKYSALSKISTVHMTDLILNRQTFINAVINLKDASLGIVPFNNTSSAIHILNLSQLICEAAKIEPMSCFISQHYFSNNFKTPKLTASLIKMQRSYTKASRKVADWASGKNTETFQLDGGPLTAEQVIAMYPYIKGVTPSELESD